MEKTCPYCAEPIRAEALRCPHCRSRLRTFVAEGWHRSHPERLIAGVAAALAHAFSVPVALVRVAFVALALVHGLGLMAYLALWLMIPEHTNEPSVLERWLVRAQGVARCFAAGKIDCDSGAHAPSAPRDDEPELPAKSA